MKKWNKMGLAVALAGLFWFAGNAEIRAQELDGTFVKQTGTALTKLADGSNKTGYSFAAGDEITITAAQGENISGIYIMWDSPVKEWNLKTEDGEKICGQNGFLHEYVALENPQNQVSIVIPEGGMSICEISIFDEGELPDYVQIWQPPCEKADIMLIPSHADDEILFFGGIIPTYLEQGGAIQVVYMTEFWSSAKVREHEKLDGLWASGLDIYPVCGNFKDVYSKTLEKAKTQYDEGAMVDYLTEQFRRFCPQVVVTHDFNGEYGHGFHMLTSEAAVLAVEAAADPQAHPESLEQYGVWDVPKTYIHLYEENAIELDLRIPLEGYEGRTALEIATDAYKQHVSQQWCWFYVDDEYEYSCDAFGLYRSTVGEDTEDSMLSNIVTYSEQERLEQERLEQERLEAEQRAAEEEARLQAIREEEKRRAEEEAAAAREQERLEQEQILEALRMKNKRKGIVAVLGGCLLLVILLVGFTKVLHRRRR